MLYKIKKMKKIVILSGWTSSEREIALRSAEFFKNYLKKEFDFFTLPEELDLFLENKEKYELAIPVFHWEYWEDWKIFAFLNILWIKTSFSPFETHAICLNKFVTNELVSNMWINVPKQYLYKWISEIKDFPQIVKPNRGWSSMFTYKVDDILDFEEKIKIIQENTTDDILVQEFISAEEYSVSIVAWEILPIMKLQKTNARDFFDYENKYSDKPQIVETWPEIEKNLENKLKNYAKQIYNLFNCKWFSRVDFLVSDNEIYFLEVNTIPWMTQNSIVPKSWALTGKSREELVETILKDTK